MAKMRNFLLLFIAGVFLKGSLGDEKSCYPDMFIQKKTKPMTTLSKHVNNLVHTETDAHIRSALFAVISKPERYECHSSKIDGYDLEISESTTIEFPKYLEISGISSFKPKFRCRVDALHRSSEDSSYYYLGQHKGNYQMFKWLSVLDPHFFIEVYEGSYKVITSGRFYPCSAEKQQEYNGKVGISSGTTSLSVLNTGMMNPIWPHYYMADHGESRGDMMLKLRKYMVLSDAIQYYGIDNKNDKFVLIKDDKMQLKLTPQSTGIDAKAEFEIRDNYWSLKVDVDRRHAEQFIKDFFPKEIPSTLIPTLCLKKDLLENVIDFYSIELKTTHGRKDGSLHNRIPTYSVRSEAFIKTNFHPDSSGGLLPVDILEDYVYFDFVATGQNLHDFEINFDKQENHCYGSGERVLFDSALKKLQNEVVYVPGLPYSSGRSPATTFNGGYPCQKTGFRLNSIKFEYMHGYPVDSLYYITVGWIENNNSVVQLHEEQYYMKFHNFWNAILE